MYSSNLGFDEFFFFSAMLTTLKVKDVLNKERRFGPLNYLMMLLQRFIRLAPIYYIVFLIGWQIGPFLGDGPCWFTYEKGFANCDQYWWSVFTMTINLVPGYVIANEGCYYWGWYPACEMQIFLVLPLLVFLIFKTKSKLLQAALVTLGVIAGLGINAYVIASNDMAAGLFAPQDIYIFKLFVNKPYTKLHAVFLGVGMALIYDSIQEYKSEVLTNGQSKSIWKHLHKSSCFAVFSYLIGFFFIAFVTLFPLPANKNPVKWTTL